LKQNIAVGEWESVITNSYLPKTAVEEILSIILSLILTISRTPENKFSVDSVQTELQFLGFTLEQANQLMAIKSTSKTPMPHFDRLQDTKWRIDVTISTRFEAQHLNYL